jgi:UTP--glucose-1-phosphate uridylyltransferase
MTHITKAVFPVAGFGTRFLPATKASPKEMLPIVDKPLIQYAVEEAIAAGVTELIFITGRHKRAIEDHFDTAYELEHELELRGKSALLETARSVLPENVSCIFIRQTQALGLGHAVLCARPVVGNDPFAVILADDLIRAEPPALKQMVDHFGHYHNSIIAVQQIPRSETRQYGIVKGRLWEDGIYKLDGIIEKPRPEDAPSTLGVVGRYILTPRIFQYLESVQRGAGGEIQLTDAIAQLLENEQVLAYEFHGKRYDCGNKLGYLEATVEYALEHPDVREQFRQYLKTLDIPG